MKRTRLTRRTPLERQPMRRGRKRSKAETQRIYGGEDRLLWIKGQRCTVLGCGRGPCENAHITTGGVGRKADADQIIPLCPTHHREFHAGVQTFARLHGLDLSECARRTEAAWQHHQRQPVKLSAIVPGVVRAIVEGGE